MSSAKAHAWAARSAALLLIASFALAPQARAAGPTGALDQRAWELVSPLDKNGGEVGAPGTPQAGIAQAAAQGEALAFGSASSFGSAQGALPVNQYIATRDPSAWSSQNLTPPALSGTYVGGAYELFSADLSKAVLSGGDRCRAGLFASCGAENPPLGPGGPVGYRNLYLREGATYTPLITTANFGALPAQPEDFRPLAQGASPDLRHVVFSAEGVLYEWSDPTIEVISSLPGAALGGSGAVSGDGSRVYFSGEGNLYLHEGAQAKLVAEAASFAGASTDGSLAFYLKAAHLYRYTASSEESTDLTPSGGAQALLGTSDDGTTLFYVASDGLYRRAGNVITKLSSASPSALPPLAGKASASADAGRLFFDSAQKLLTQDTDASPDVYEWEAQGIGSCTRAGGCLGLVSDGRSGEASLIDASASGADVFFATRSALLPADLDSSLDAYDAREGGGQPEAPGPACLGDDCPDPTPVPGYSIPPTSTLPGRGNPPLRFAKQHEKKRHHHRRRPRHHHPHTGGARR